MSLRSTRLNLETLEDRCCPTTISASNGVLTITGDDGPNHVSISQKDSGDGLTINYDSWTPQGLKTFSQSYFSSFCHAIVLDLKGGDDSVNYTLWSDFLYAKSVWGFFGTGNDHFGFYSGVGYSVPSPAHLKADLAIHLFMNQSSKADVDLRFGQVDGAKLTVSALLGDGDDKFSAQLNGDLTGSADVAFTVLGGAGNDEMTITGGYYTPNLPGKPSTKVPMHVGAEAKLNINLQGGEGEDDLFLSIYTENDGQIRYHLDGGDGVDIVIPWISQTNGSTGQVIAY